jgi:alpha-glucosidase (family GH31 glycosyl hydrolase)
MMEILIGPHRTIWYDYDDELVKITQTYVGTHHDLIPYIRSSMYQATQTGMPVMRSLIFVYPGDESLSDTWDEYLYGQDLLVAPVVTAGAAERKVYLPAGQWLDYNDKKTVLSGPATITASAPLAAIPLFVREGAIIPRGDILKANNNWDANWSPKLHIEVFASSKSASRFDYFTGDSVRTITASPSGNDLTVKFGDLGVNGTLEIYCGKPEGVTRNGKALQSGADFQYDVQTQKLSVPFQGATTLAINGAGSLFGAAGGNH